MLLENDAFLSGLTKMFGDSKSGKSLFITMKRYDGRTKPVPRKSKGPVEPQQNAENTCLIRVTIGSKKMSTVVHQKDMNKFNQAYANVLKANIDGLKKRDKKNALVSQSKPSVPAATATVSPSTPTSTAVRSPKVI